MVKSVLKEIKELAQGVYDTILKKKQPNLDMPLRSLNNVKYDPKEGYFELLGKKKERTLTAGTVKTFAQTLRMMSLSKNLIETDDIASKREAYYISKNWGEAKFKEQPESDMVMDDIEAMLMVNREQIGFIPEELKSSHRITFKLKNSLIEIQEFKEIPTYFEVESPNEKELHTILELLEVDKSKVRNWNGWELFSHYGVAP